MHRYNIKCPGGEFDYQWAAQHRYQPSGSPFQAWSTIVFSDVSTINC
jgi:hypothetical protein